ncbi:hypothetical protein T492DRAFT_841582 [Pavlovales sp. CCMP2436]|nr:hypothetical protein T492DRAFT_841582 [Pavlovales sp. CCMP2436]
MCWLTRRTLALELLLAQPELKCELKLRSEELESWSTFHGALHLEGGPNARASMDSAIDNEEDNYKGFYSKFTREHLHTFTAPCHTEPLSDDTMRDASALKTYLSQLESECEEWRESFARFARLLKQPGNLVYHPRYDNYAGGPATLFPKGYHVYGAGVDVSRAVGAAVGDRVKLNFGKRGNSSVCERLGHETGEITSIDYDCGTELSVRWSNGETNDNIKCGKKNNWWSVYA